MDHVNENELIDVMSECEQTPGTSVYQHGLDVFINFSRLAEYMQTKKLTGLAGMKIPDWFLRYADQIAWNMQKLHNWNTLNEYCIFHDCGKPYCRVTDPDGTRHFPNHAETSYDVWMGRDGSPSVGNLILHDMDIHELKPYDLKTFAERPNAITHLIVGLAEIHANAVMFGGIDSVGFKIKYAQIERRGKQLCKLLFKDQKNVKNCN